MVDRTFREAVAPLYSQEGVLEFLRFSGSESIRARAGKNSNVFAARMGNEICGVVEVRERKHILMLFVKTEVQRLGVGRMLLQRALDSCRTENPQLREVTVNSSPNAVEAYRRFGFVVAGPETEKKGIRFTPMRMTIRRESI